MADAYSNLTPCNCGAQPLHLHRAGCARIKGLRDIALAAATGTAKTAERAECEASQSGGSASERNAQTQSSTPDNKDKQ